MRRLARQQRNTNSISGNGEGDWTPLCHIITVSIRIYRYFKPTVLSRKERRQIKYEENLARKRPDPPLAEVMTTTEN